MLLEVNLASRMETATIEQLHRFKHLHLQSVEKLPPIRRLSRDQGLTRACAFKEFRFEPPYVSKKKERRRKKLPPIPENMLPRHHGILTEEPEYEDEICDLPPLPSLSISPAFITDRTDERSLSVEVTTKSPNSHMFNTREFTFPESSSKKKKHTPSQIVPALTPRNRDTPIQAKIEKLAKQKRKERAKRAIEKRYEKKIHNMADMTSPTSHMAFKAKREPDTQNVFHLKEHKQSPFKQMVRAGQEDTVDKPKINPRLYTRIVDSIYSYTKGMHEQQTRGQEAQGPYERLMVTPATNRDTTEIKDNVGSRQLTAIPPIV
ncbi:hypothetical protein ACF0H5_011474 [Mactra antiquata]